MMTMKKKIDAIFNNKADVAGVLLFIAAIIIFMGIITAESYYPLELCYTTRENEISDLGASEPPESIITQPSAAIFNTTMLLTGLMILSASVLIYYSSEKLYISAPLTFLGIGILGIGLFPGNITPYHSIFAFITFTSGGIGAILSFKTTRFPLKYVFPILGVIALVFLFFNQLFIPYLGDGGTERFIAYPILFWMAGFGIYLIEYTKK